MRLIEHRFRRPLPALLRALRVEGFNVGEIAERLEVPYATVHRWLVLFRLDDATLIRAALELTAGDGRPSAEAAR